MRAIEKRSSRQSSKSPSLVVLNLGAGNLEEGFPYINAQLWTDRYSLPERFSGRNNDLSIIEH